MKIVSFAGHRPDKVGGYRPSKLAQLVKERLREELIACGAIQAISGMALGVDQWAAEICIDLGIPFTAAVPFSGHESYWPQKAQAAYGELLSKAKEVVIVSSGGYSARKMQVRNEWMVDHCSVLICVWDGSDGGTANCVRYAEKVGRAICRIDPSVLLSQAPLAEN